MGYKEIISDQIQWISDRVIFIANSLIAVLDRVKQYLYSTLCQDFMLFIHKKYEKYYMKSCYLTKKYNINQFNMEVF